MYFSIDPSDGVPIYEQIVRQVKYAVADKVLVGGQMVPSVRQLAQQLAINPNTIARAYQQLQNDRVLEGLRGKGLVVRSDAFRRCTKARDRLLADRLRGVLAEALQGGIPPDELRRLFDQHLQELTQPQ
jgi:GntR family transcriptional regulator